MTIRINNIILGIEDDKNILKKKAAKKLNIKEEHIHSLKIIKESIDARKKDNIRFNYCVDVRCENEKLILKRNKDNNIKLEEDKKKSRLNMVKKK